MKTLKFQFVIAAALLAGVAIGYFARPSDAVTSDSDEEYVPRKRIAETGENADAKALRRRIAKLERLLEKKDAASETAISNAVAEAMKNKSFFGRPHGNPREWMENLKKNEPERFAQMTNHFARQRQFRIERARSRIDFLSSVDTSRMSAGAKKTHDELQELIAKREELEEQIHQEDLTEDERHEIFEQLRETQDEMRRLNGEERQNLLEETAKVLGFEGENVKDIAGTVQNIIEATDGTGHDRMMPPPDGEPGPGGGPAPGGPGGR